MDLTTLNLSDYDFIAPSEISILNLPDTNFIDIEVEDDHSFFVLLKNSNSYILSHNCDGISIVCQMLNILFTYWPELITKGKVYSVQSPLIIAKHKKTKEKQVFYSLKEFNSKQTEYDIIEYNKGLGSLSKEEYKKLVDNPQLIKFDATASTESRLNMVFGKGQQDQRKEWLLDEGEYND
jgi:DNA gyrase/topoisomerase IV subunit B